MNKIVELIINMEEFEFEDLGVEIMSLVDKPAIEVNWLAFSEELEFRENPDCPDGFEHQMPDGSWMCGKEHGYCEDCFDLEGACWPGYEAVGMKNKNGKKVPNCVPIANSAQFKVDNTGFKKFNDFFNKNIDLFKKPGGGAAGDSSVDHGEQMELLNEAGISTEYPFGYCYQVAQFLFYAMGGYDGPYDLKCIKKMQYKVKGVDFEATHWYIENKDDGTIVDLTASQFDGILDIDKYYSEGKRANLGFPYYNVGDDRVEFENTVPSLQSLKLYDKWREDNEKLPELEKYWKAAKYEELRKVFTELDFAAVGPEVDDDRIAFEKHVIEIAKEVGETVDPEEIIYVNADKSQFASIEEVLQGIRALDVLGNLTDEEKKQKAEIRYRYAGPSAQRSFCVTLKALNKIYKDTEIDQMDTYFRRYGHNKEPYSVFKWKSGPNCRHFWEKLLQYKSNGRNVLVSLGPAEGDAGKTNNEMSPSSAGAVPNNARYPFSTWSFSDDDQMVVVGPSMIPLQLIPRRDEMGNLFHVYFSKDTIEKIAQKFLADNNTHNTDINHNDDITTNNTLLESWIVSDPKMDKSTAMGFNVPEGTWMTSYKINDKATWKKIKDGELNGFSVSGSFLEVIQKNG